MSETPFINWCPSDWLAATRHLSLEERAVYHDLLMMFYEQHGVLPADWQRIGRLMGIAPKRLKRIVATLIGEGKITVVDGMVTNARAEKELKKREKKSVAAKRSAEARWKLEREKSNKNNETDMRSQCGRNASEHANQNQNHTTAATTRTRAHDADPIEASEGANPHLDADAGPPRDADSPSSARPGPPEDADSSPGTDPADVPPTVRDRITALLDRVLKAANVDISKDRNPQRWFGSEPRLIIQRWIDLGLTDDEIVGKIAEVMARPSMRSKRIGRLDYFDGAMADLAGLKQAPPLSPNLPAPGGTNGSGRPPAGHSPARQRVEADASRDAALAGLFARGLERG